MLACFENAIRVYRSIGERESCAMVQNNLGYSLWTLAHAHPDNAVNYLRRAHRSLRLALKVRREGTMPLEWAMSMNNLGLVVRDSSQQKGNKNLYAAVNCFCAALRIRTLGEYPRDWATTQSNLGIAHLRLADTDLRHTDAAIEAFQNSLSIRTFHHLPRDWAFTSVYLGLTYLRRRDRVPQGVGILRSALPLLSVVHTHLRVRAEAALQEVLDARFTKS